tara:strand:+ start:591 stop:740 length:150 start_codon:yes stop_codon:yes gene_type:complete
MTVVTTKSQKLRDKLAALERKLDYADGEKYDALILQIENLIDEINIIEN